MREAILHGGRVTCDIDGCASPAFVSYSLVTLVRIQMTAIGWARTKLSTLPDWKALEHGSDGRRKLDTCPACTAEIRHEHALWLADAPRRKAEAKAAKEIARVAAKAVKQQAQLEARLSKSRTTAAKRDALAAAKRQRKQARATSPPEALAAPS